jgi:hypothetical protein
MTIAAAHPKTIDDVSRLRSLAGLASSSTIAMTLAVGLVSCTGSALPTPPLPEPVKPGPVIRASDEVALPPVAQPSELAWSVPGGSLYLGSGAHAAMRVDREVASGAPMPERWTVIRRVLDRPPANGLDTPADRGLPARIQQFVKTADGGVALAEEINQGEKVEVVFVPPLVVLPGVLEPGREARQQLSMIVHPLGNRGRIRSKGPIDNVVRIEGWESVSIAGVPVRALRLRASFKADLSPASVLHDQTQWYVPSRGLVKELDRERTTVLGVPIRDNREEWELAATRETP